MRRETDEQPNRPLDHAATPKPVRFDWVPHVRQCAICGRYLRRSTTSPTGWRHSGLNP